MDALITKLPAIIDNAGQASARAVDEAAAADRGAHAIDAATALEAATLPKFDALLATRIAGFESARNHVGQIIAAALALAFYLFVGFFLSVRGAVAQISGRLRSLTERDTTDLRAGLEAVAQRGSSRTWTRSRAWPTRTSASSEEVSASAEQTSASTEQIAASAQELANTAGELSRLVGAFTVA